MIVQRTCEWCSATFEATRATARYCTPSHRTAAYRARRKDGGKAAPSVTDPVTSGSQPDGEYVPGLVEAATIAELEAANCHGSALGLAARALAQRIDHGALETGSALAALVRVHAAALTRALEPGGEMDPFDELERKREQRRAQRASS